MVFNVVLDSQDWRRVCIYDILRSASKKPLLQWSVVKNILTSGISQWLPECIRYTAPENYSLCTLRIVFNYFKRVGAKRDRLVSAEHENVV